jgi:PhzF family phenazine biosynthesis protein
MKYYVVDAFTDKIFAGNPAGICIMNQWLPDDLMLKIAKENNLSETAFTVKKGNVYDLRWFTPGGEIELCGHATLATAFVISNFVEPDNNVISFQTLSGLLTVIKKDQLYEMDFPAYELSEVPVTKQMEDALHSRPTKAYLGRDLLCVFENESDVRKMVPDQKKLLELDGLLVNVTARSQNSEFDCISRSFAPKLNIPEDPVCGSGHCHIIPYWAKQLNKQKLVAYQASTRGGILYCEYLGKRIKISGKAALYSIGEIYLKV